MILYLIKLMLGSNFPGINIDQNEQAVCVRDPIAMVAIYHGQWRFRGPRSLSRGAQSIPFDRESLNFSQGYSVNCSLSNLFSLKCGVP